MTNWLITWLFNTDIVIHNSQLLAGYVDKGTLGSGSKSSIFYFILRDFGKNQAAEALLRLSKLTSWFLSKLDGREY